MTQESTSLPAPLQVALGNAQEVVVTEMVALVCAPQGCAVLAQWLVSEMGVKPWIANLAVRAVAQALTLGSRALGKKGLEVLATRLQSLPFIDRLIGKIGEIVSAVAGGQIRSHAQLAQFLAGDRAASDIYVDGSLGADVRLQIRQVQELEGLRTAVDQVNEAILALAQSMADQNVLPLDWPRASSSNYLYFGSAQIPFFGREGELEDLQAWLEDDAHAVGWRLVHGDGGQGKSRLALELCRRNAHLWSTGFLSRDVQMKFLDAWRPVEPTLIVIDYAALDPEGVRALLLTFGRHGHQFDFPVRVLLLERGGEDDRWYSERFLSGSNLDDENLKGLRTGAPLALGHLGPEALWDLMNKVADEPSKLGTPEEAFDALGRIDPGYRALFAVLVARQLGSSAGIESLDRGELIDNLLRHERQKIWRPYVSGMTSESFAAHVNLLALATFVGRIPLARIWKIGHPGLPSEADYDAGLMRRMCGRDCDEDAWPLEPDLVGERLLLTQLRDTSPPRLSSRPFLPTVFAAPLEIEDWFYAAQVLDRLVIDYPKESVDVLKLPPSENVAVEARLPLAMAAMSALGRWSQAQTLSARALYENLKAFAGDDQALKVEAAKGGFNLVNQTNDFDLDAACEIYEDLKVFAGDDPALRQEVAKSATNLLGSWPTDRIGEGFALYEGLKALAGDDPGLRLEAARGGFNLLNQVRTVDLDAARGVYEDLKTLAGDDPTIRLEAARGAKNLLGRWSADRIDEGRDLFEDVRTFAGDDVALMIEAAKGGKNLLGQWPPDRVADDGRALYETLKVFAGDNADLRLEAIQAATNLLGKWPLDRLDEGLEFYDDLDLLAGEDVRLGLQVAQAATNLLGRWPPDRVDEGRAFYDRVRTRTPGDAASELEAAKGATNLLSEWPTDRIDSGLALWRDLKAFAGDALGLQQEAARAGTNLVSQWPTDRVADGRAFYEEMKSFAGDDPDMRLQAIQSGFNFMNRTRAADLDAALDLYGDLKAFAGVEAELRLYAARGAKNMLGDWPPERADEGRALFDDLKVLAGDDPAIRLEAVQGATNLLGQWPSDRIEAGLALHEDLKTFVGDDVALKRYVAGSGKNLLGQWPPDRGRQGLTFLESLEVFAGDDAALKREVAQSGFNLLNRVRLHDLSDALVIYHAIKAFAGDDVTLSVEVVRGGVNMLLTWPPNRENEGRVLLNDIRSVAGDDPALGFMSAHGGIALGIRLEDATMIEEALRLASAAELSLTAADPAYPLMERAYESRARILEFLHRMSLLENPEVERDE